MADNDTVINGETGQPRSRGISDRIKGLQEQAKPKDFIEEVRDAIDPRPSQEWFSYLNVSVKVSVKNYNFKISIHNKQNKNH